MLHQHSESTKIVFVIDWDLQQHRAHSFRGCREDSAVSDRCCFVFRVLHSGGSVWQSVTGAARLSWPHRSSCVDRAWSFGLSQLSCGRTALFKFLVHLASQVGMCI